MNVLYLLVSLGKSFKHFLGNDYWDEVIKIFDY